MAHQDIYQVTDRQRLAGQEIFNVYFFRVSSGAVSPVADDMIDAFVGQVLPEIVTLQVGALVHEQVDARNLFNPSDKATRSISVPGGNPGETWSTNFDAVGIQLNQTNGAVKNGAKRIAGMPDSVANNGVIVDPIWLTALVALCVQLSGTLNWGIIATFIPVVVKRLLVSPGNYELPSSLLLATWGDIISAAFSPLMTSQVSRKIGNGA